MHDFNQLIQIADSVESSYFQLRRTLVEYMPRMSRHELDHIIDPLQDLATAIGMLNQWICSREGETA